MCHNEILGFVFATRDEKYYVKIIPAFLHRTCMRICHFERKNKMRLRVNNAHRQTLEMTAKITGPIRLSKQNCAKGTGMSVPFGRDGKRGILQNSRPFVPENFRSNRAFNLHSYRLNRQFCLNGKRPGISKNVLKIFPRLGNNVENVRRCPQRSLSITEVKRVMIQ